jgi:NifB/MoaA-like Fe-S oxidoreductase
VPVGLTGYRNNLPHLRPVSTDEALKLIEMIDNYQSKNRKETGLGLVYLADEFYLKAELDFPKADYYDDYCQIENGIGLARLFLDQFEELEHYLPVLVDIEACLITSISGNLVLKPVTERLNRIEGLSLSVLPITNQFFGGNVSVTGLLTGKDIIAALGSNYEGKKVILPEVVLKQGEDVLLDNISIKDIEKITGARIFTVDGTARDLVDTILKK